MERYLGMQTGFLHVMSATILLWLYIKVYNIDAKFPLISEIFGQIVLPLLLSAYILFSMLTMIRAKKPKMEDVLSGKVHDVLSGKVHQEK